MVKYPSLSLDRESGIVLFFMCTFQHN